MCPRLLPAVRCAECGDVEFLTILKVRAMATSRPICEGVCPRASAASTNRPGIALHNGHLDGFVMIYFPTVCDVILARDWFTTRENYLRTSPPRTRTHVDLIAYGMLNTASATPPPWIASPVAPSPGDPRATFCGVRSCRASSRLSVVTAGP